MSYELDAAPTLYQSILGVILMPVYIYIYTNFIDIVQLLQSGDS